MKRENQNRKLRGSVLFTVVFVMTILIVLLFGTLTLAIASDNRARVNYSSAQTGITARMITDAAIQAIGDRGPGSGVHNYADAIAAIDKDHTQVYNITVNTNSNSIGTDTHPRGSMGIVRSCTAQYAGERRYYDTSTHQWEPRDIIKISTEVERNGVVSTSSAYVIKHKSGDSPASSSKKGGGAGFVSAAGTSISHFNNIFGGGYINIPKWQDSWASIYNEGVDPTTLSSDFGGTFTIGNGRPIHETPIYVCQDYTLEQLGGLIFEEGQGITVWGDLKLTNNSNINSLVNKASGKASLDFNKVPYVFVSGTLDLTDLSSDYNLFSVNPLNVFCGRIDTGDSAKESTFACDIYMMDNGASNKMKFMHTSNLYAWGKSVVRGDSASPVSMSTGNIFCNGKLELENINIDGNVYIKNESDLTLGSNVTIGGSVISGADAYPRYANKRVITGQETLAGGTPANESDVAKTKVIDTIKEVNDMINLYSFGSRDDLITAGKFTMADYESAKKTVYTSQGVAAYTKAKYKWVTDAVTGNKTLEEDGAPVTVNSSNVTISENCVIDFSGGWGSSSGSGITFKPTSTSGNLFIIVRNLVAANACNVFVDDTDGMVSLFLEYDGKTKTTYGLNGIDYVLGEGETLPAGAYNVSTSGSGMMAVQNNLLTKSYKEAFQTTGNIITYRSTSPGGGTEVRLDHPLKPDGTVDTSIGLGAPKLYIYGGPNTVLDVSNTGMLTANVLSSEMKVTIKATNDSGIKATGFYYDGNDLLSQAGGADRKISNLIVGSLTAGEIEAANQYTTIFIDDNGTDAPAGTGTGVSGDDKYIYRVLYYTES